MEKLVKLNLFGDLGESVGKSWELSIKSVAEGIRAINSLTKNSFNDYFIRNNKLQAKYRVLINGRDFTCPVEELNIENAEMVYQSELVIKNDNLNTIDIVPFIENSDSKVLGVVLAAVLIVVGVILLFTPLAPLGVALIIAGVGLGVAVLLSKLPSFGEPGKADKAGKNSYLFGGPINIIGEGGPIPLAYGRILAGSQVISSAYKIQDYLNTRN